jgi:hypothetical protein
MPINTIAYFVFVEIFVKPISRFARKENASRNKTIPSFTSRVVNSHPISSEIISLIFQKMPKKKAPRIASFMPDES